MSDLFDGGVWIYLGAGRHALKLPSGRLVAQYERSSLGCDVYSVNGELYHGEQNAKDAAKRGYLNAVTAAK
mgnify:CR=1 FL=1